MAVWSLTSAGHRLASEVAACHWPYRTGEPTTRFLAHELGIAQAHLVSLRAAASTKAELTVQIERQARRNYPGPGGGRLLIRPDLALTLSGHDPDGPYADHWFAEVDLGTESLPTLLGKAEQYEAYYRSGTEQAVIGTFPLIVWRFHGPKRDQRAEALKTKLSAATNLTERLHRFVTDDVGLQALLVGGGAE